MTTALYGTSYGNYNIYNDTGSYGTYGTYTGGYSSGSGAYNSIFSADGINQLQQRYEYNQEARNLSKSATNKTNAEVLSVKDQCENISLMLKEGRENDVLGEYNKLLELLRSQPQYQDLNEKELKSIARNIFQTNTGVSLTEAIEKNCSGDFATGFKKQALWGQADSLSKEDLLAEITGVPKKAGSTATKIFGGVFGTIGALIGWIPALFGVRG